MFGNQQKREENKKEAISELVQKYGIEDLAENEAIKELVIKLSNTDTLNLTAALSGNQPDRVKINYLCAITEQNWIIINQLNRLNSNIEKMMNK